MSSTTSSKFRSKVKVQVQDKQYCKLNDLQSSDHNIIISMTHTSTTTTITKNCCHYQRLRIRLSRRRRGKGGESILNNKLSATMYSSTSSRIIDVIVIVVMMIVFTVIVPSSVGIVGVMALPRSSNPFGIISNTAAVATSTSRSTSSSGTSNSSAGNKLQRGKVLEKEFNEYDLLRAYREIQSEYRNKAFGDEYYSNNDGEGEETSSSSSQQQQQQQQQQWKVLTTMDPNKNNKKYNNDNDNNDDEIIRVSMLEHPSDPLCPYVKMEAIIPKSVEKCWNFLSLDKWDETMPKMDPFYEGLGT
jgi:hypothetical protein